MTDHKEHQHEICLSLGSNLGDRLAMLRKACAELAPYVTITAKSGIYQTKPAYVTDQPLFLNAAICGTTTLDPMGLLYTLRDIELEMGRLPTFHYGPRLIDIDIIFYDTLTLHMTELTIPHTLMAERLFVLKPLSDIAPDWQHPVFNKTVAELLAALPTGAEATRLSESL